MWSSIAKRVDSETRCFRSHQDEVHLRPTSGVCGSLIRDSVLGLALKDNIRAYQKMMSEIRFASNILPTVVYGCDDIGLLSEPGIHFCQH